MSGEAMNLLCPVCDAMVRTERRTLGTLQGGVQRTFFVCVRDRGHLDSTVRPDNN